MTGNSLAELSMSIPEAMWGRTKQTLLKFLRTCFFLALVISIVQEKSFDDLIVLLSSKGLQQDSHADIKTMPQNHA